MMININKLSWHEKMKLLRIMKGWSQREAAEKCGTNQKVYWLWENGKSYPRRNSRRAIAMAFEVAVEDIFSKPA